MITFVNGVFRKNSSDIPTAMQNTDNFNGVISNAIKHNIRMDWC